MYRNSTGVSILWRRYYGLTCYLCRLKFRKFGWLTLTKLSGLVLGCKKAQVNANVFDRGECE
jgi:hypothetical protein